MGLFYPEHGSKASRRFQNLRDVDQSQGTAGASKCNYPCLAGQFSTLIHQQLYCWWAAVALPPFSVRLVYTETIKKAGD
jgi:hypothetical protein